MHLVKGIFESLTKLSSIQTEPLLIMYSNEQIIIEDVQALLSFSNEKISIRCALGRVEAHGEDLLINALAKDEIVLRGKISGVRFYPKVGDDDE